MTKEQKIQILDDLIAKVEACSYSPSGLDIKHYNIELYVENAKSFIAKFMPNPNYWVDKMDLNTHNGTLISWTNAKANFINILNSIKFEIELSENLQAAQPAQFDNNQEIKSDKVFIVHGHNETMKLAVDSVIRKLGLTPIILHEQPNIGRTIIEKFEKLSEDVSFAIVLLSADDEMKDGKYRARQNVILELGYFIAKLGRKNVVALYQTSSEIEIPSDISGVLYEPYDNPYGNWRYNVVRELKAVGFDVDANKI